MENGSHAGQLYRVGDHTFDESTPSGRYVEYGYTLNTVVNSSGAIVDGTDSLLASVRDVRGETWTYDYYGQNSGGEDVRQLNFLVEHQSPNVDITGDTFVNDSLTLKQIAYTMQGTELLEDGGLEDTSANSWPSITGSEPVTNAQSTTQVESGTNARQVVADAVGEGIESNTWDLKEGQTYIITAQVYPVSGTVKMQVPGQSAFERLTSGTGLWQLLRAVYEATADDSDLQLQFVANTLDSGSCEFYLDTVSVIASDLSVDAISQDLGDALQTKDLVFRADETLNTTETIAGKTRTHLFFGGVYGGIEDPAGNKATASVELSYRPYEQTDANGNFTSLGWSTDGKHLESVADALDNETSFIYDTSDRLTRSTDAEGRETAYTYDDASNPRLPTEIKVLDTDGSTVRRWQQLTYDAGRVLTEEVLDPSDGTGNTTLQRVTREYYDNTDGDVEGLLKKVTREDLTSANDDVTTAYLYDTFGRVVQTNQSATFGACHKSRTVYDDAGKVVASICNYEPGASSAPTNAAEAAALYSASTPDDNHVTTHAYDTLGRRVATTIMAGSAFAQMTLTVYDALNRVVRTISNYVADAGVAHPYTALRSAFDHGADNTDNLVTDIAYNERGLVKSRTDALGNVTLYGYDDADRLVKTVQNASQPTYDNTYGTGGDPDLSGYTANSEPDEDIISEQAYDANGNLVKTVDARGSVTFTVYDALNRPVKTVRSAKDDARVDLNEGDTGYDAANDPRSTSYEPSSALDRDHINTTEYDKMGRVIRTTDALGLVTLYGYDSLGRQVKVIRNAVTASYDIAGDPDLSGYSTSVATDKDIVTETAYNDLGQILNNMDPLGMLTHHAYDGFGRQTDVVQNYDATGVDTNPQDWNWDSGDSRWEDSDGDAIPHGDEDQNIIARTVYDDEGRVQKTQDVLNRWTLYGYDGQNRQVKVVRNAATPTYNQVTDPDLSGYTESTASDEDIVTQTVYDAQGRVAASIDQHGNETHFAYDVLGRRVLSVVNFYDDGNIDDDVSNWVWDETNAQWEDGSSVAIPRGVANDQNVISHITYDMAGRVAKTRDAAGLENRYEYDDLGRRVKTIANYVNGEYDAATPDEDLSSETVYNKAGQVIETVDARGTKTAFTYDAAGRRQTVTRAAETAQATTDWTCYDKGGRVLRTIRACTYDSAVDDHAPDEIDAQGDWLYMPVDNGQYEDRDLITLFEYDDAGRQVKITDPVGNETATTYAKDGQVFERTDAEGHVTRHVYDSLRRLTRIVQNYTSTVAPEGWVWNDTAGVWEDGTTNPDNDIDHGTDNDENIIVDVALDTVGRRTSLTDPRGNVTLYSYDKLNRRTGLTNPLNKTWTTAYSDLTGGAGTRVTLTDPLSHATRRDTDRLGRMSSIAYVNESPNKDTPDVSFGYDAAGNRISMTESDGTGTVRETLYGYDDARRLTSVGFDTDGDSTVEETVSYSYDAGGLRTSMTLPGSLTITYAYDDKGQLVSLTDWDDQEAAYAYDLAGRLIAAKREDSFRSRYAYDAAGRLRLLQHSDAGRVLGHFAYEVDGLGNRTSATEALPHPGTGTTTIASDDTIVDYVRGSWATSGDFEVSDDISAALRIPFFGSEATLTLGVGPDYGLCDVYVNGMLWRSFDNYAASAGEDVLTLDLQGDGPHVLEVKNRAEKNQVATGTKLGFKQLVVDGQYDLHTIQYGYDGLARLLSADYYSGDTASGTPFKEHTYVYDLAGNRTYDRIDRRLDPPATVLTHYAYSYNDANQIVYQTRAATVYDPIPVTHSFVYDDAGRITSDGVNSYTWDRANRLLSMGGIDYAYDGLGNRISQEVNSVVTTYLNDIQPGLTKVLSETVSGNTTRYLHGPMGIQSSENWNRDWTHTVQDGLGSVRGEVSDTLAVNAVQHYEPYGVPFDGVGTFSNDYGFTGEQTDGNSQVYLRARYYNPSIGVFTSIDPFEGIFNQAMSLNEYSYVHANPVNWTDPSGLCLEGNLCDELQKLGLTDVAEAVGCTNTKQCCGYDVTPWFVQELWNHGNYMENALASSRQIPLLPFPFNFQLSHHATSLEYITDEFGILNGFRTYAAAIPHKWMNFADSSPNSDCPSGSNCTRSVTLCGTCIDRSELGNVMFGYAGGKLALNQDILWGAARVIGALRGEAEKAAAGIGIHLSAQHIGTVNEFCNQAKTATNRFPDGSRWDWTLLNTGQNPDVSQCEPCTDLLPSNYPHTVALLNNPVAGESVWADNSVIQGSGEDSVRPFYVSQIPDTQYLSPELCADLNDPTPLCGNSIKAN